MSVTSINQKPAVLSPKYVDNIKDPFQPAEHIRNCIIKPLYTPQIPSQPASIQDDKGQPIQEDTILENLVKACGELFDAPSDAFCKEVFNNCLQYYRDVNGQTTTLSVDELYPVQAARKEGLPDPNDLTVYTPAVDIIPSAKHFLSGTGTYEKFFASLAFYARPNTLGFYFANEIAFDDFITWVKSQMVILGNVTTPDTNKIMGDFYNLKLHELTESIMVRTDDTFGNEPFSFPRLIVNLLMRYTGEVGPGEFGILPFSIAELFCPRTIVFVNVERHAKATPTQIKNEWDLINKSLDPNHRPKVMSNKALQKLTAVQRNLQKQISQAANNLNRIKSSGRHARMKFSNNRPTATQYAKYVEKLIMKMNAVNRSMNVYKQVKPSFLKPNRRDPDDFNKMGKIVSQRYKPDLHLYIDTSGSISKQDYEDTVKTCIAIAKRLGINMYFNSFSDYMTATTRLHLENKTVAQIYGTFEKVPKAHGGTDYEQIWRFINESSVRRRELSIIISDFEWTARRVVIKHPKNLYYIPCSTMDWKQICASAKEFCESAKHNEPNIRAHLLF